MSSVSFTAKQEIEQTVQLAEGCDWMTGVGPARGRSSEHTCMGVFAPFGGIFSLIWRCEIGSTYRRLSRHLILHPHYEVEN